MPNYFIKFGGTRTSRQYGEMYTSRTFFGLFDPAISCAPLQKKNIQRFQALNGLKCRIQVQMHPWMLVETTRVTKFEYYFACTRKGVHLYSVVSPGKMIFAVLEL